MREHSKSELALCLGWFRTYICIKRNQLGNKYLVKDEEDGSVIDGSCTRHFSYFMLLV